MPIYEYRCEKCGEVFEALVKIGEDNTACPKCNVKGATRIFSTFSARSSDGRSIAGDSNCSSCSSSNCDSCSK